MNGDALFDMYIISGSDRLINPRSSASSMEILEVTSGEVLLSVGTEKITLHSGDIVYVPTGVILSAEVPDGYASVRGVSFTPSIFEDALENFDTEVLSMFYIKSRTGVVSFTSSDRITHALSRCMDAAADEYFSKELCYKLVIKANIFFMISAILRRLIDLKIIAEKLGHTGAVADKANGIAKKCDLCFLHNYLSPRSLSALPLTSL